ncbi:PREDICTED: uncharacterized protein LOC107104754 [Cyprinodon variegatus]|uniref:uncharacterized protein LOC107104754 n=1 Tax=Cyprinodon variegatus TaxID=28743 RepID=UPI0007429D6A|nr:PREDICTED: uncharacterized protein LOC107104754 [Cyprinodon variegatus]
MASSGLLLLLLVSSSFLVCSLSAPQPSDLQETHALQKRGQIAKTTKTAAEYLLMIATSAKPFIGLIPEAGGYLTAIIDFANDVSGNSPESKLLNFLEKEFANLNLKIDENQKQLKWHIWASSNYGKLQGKITDGYNKLQELLKDCKKPCLKTLKDQGKEPVIQQYFGKAEKYVDSLHGLVIKSGSHLADYEKLLTDHVRCNEKSIKAFAAINAALMHEAITMTHFYYRFKNIKDANLEDRLAKKAREISEAMFKIQVNCMSDPDPYVKLNVEERIDDSQDRKVLAENIRKYLDTIYYRYDWIVVAFLKDDEEHKNRFNKWRKKHFLTGFSETSKGKTSVAFAKQAKGNHKKTTEVTDVLKKCYNKVVSCDKVTRTLESCKEQVGNAKLKDTYSVIHAYFKKHSHKHESVLSLDAAEAPSADEFNPDVDQPIPYTYTGKCSFNIVGKLDGPTSGKFRVLIKSDEERMKVDPCKNVDCGEKEKRGKCVEVKSARIGLCECHEKYYGERCEESLEDYKKSLASIEI